MQSPPETRSACLQGVQHAPNPHEPQLLAQNNSGIAVAQACAENVDDSPLFCGSYKHLISRFQILPAGHRHFAAEQCSQCGCHLRWVPRPQNVERQRSNAFRLARLAMCDGLTHWERGFVASVAKQKKVSPKQQQIIDRLCADYLEAAKRAEHERETR